MILTWVEPRSHSSAGGSSSVTGCSAVTCAYHSPLSTQAAAVRAGSRCFVEDDQVARSVTEP